MYAAAPLLAFYMLRKPPADLRSEMAAAQDGREMRAGICAPPGDRYTGYLKL